MVGVNNRNPPQIKERVQHTFIVLRSVAGEETAPDLCDCNKGQPHFSRAVQSDSRFTAIVKKPADPGYVCTVVADLVRRP